MIICKINDCPDEAKTKELCSHHYYKLRTYGDPNFKKEKVFKQCKLDGCSGKIIARDLCWKHYHIIMGKIANCCEEE